MLWLLESLHISYIIQTLSIFNKELGCLGLISSYKYLYLSYSLSLLIFHINSKTHFWFWFGMLGIHIYQVNGLCGLSLFNKYCLECTFSYFLLSFQTALSHLPVVWGIHSWTMSYYQYWIVHIKPFLGKWFKAYSFITVMIHFQQFLSMDIKVNFYIFCAVWVVIICTNIYRAEGSVRC